MRVHYLRCGTDCPFGGPLFDGFSRSLIGVIPCPAQLVETEGGLVLIDTGYGSEDVRHPYPPPPVTRWAAKAARGTSGTTANHVRAVLRLGDNATRDAIGAMTALEPRRTTFAHGEIFASGAAERLHESFAWIEGEDVDTAGLDP